MEPPGSFKLSVLINKHVYLCFMFDLFSRSNKRDSEMCYSVFMFCFYLVEFDGHEPPMRERLIICFKMEILETFSL